MKKIIGENNRREKWRKGPEMRSVRPWNELMMTSAVGQKEIAGRRCGRRGRRSQSKSQLQVEAKAFLLFCLASVFFKQAKAGDGEGDGWLPATKTLLITKNDRTRTGEHRWKSPHAASPPMASFPCRFLNCWPKFLGKNDRGFSSETTKEQTTEQTIWNFLRARDGWQNGRSSPETGHQSRPLTSSGIHHHDGSWCWFKLRLAPTRPSLAVSLPFFSIFDFARQTLSVNGFTYMNVTNVVGWNNGLRCSSTFFHNFGLPCRHILYLSEKEKILLLVEEYKRRWRLNDTDEVKINQELL